MSGINTRFAVGIHIMTLLEANKDEKCTSEWIAGSVNTNPVVIRRITGMLHKAGLVEVRPGVAGAKLARSAEEITLLDIYRAVQAAPENALFGVHEQPNPECPVGRNIQQTIIPIFAEAQQALENVLARTTLTQVMNGMPV